MHMTMEQQRHCWPGQYKAALLGPRSSAPHVSDILQLRPKLVRRVRGYLPLKDALVLRSTCRQLYQDNNDTFRFSSLYNTSPNDANHIENQKRLFTRLALQSPDKLCALIHNETLPTYYFYFFIRDVLKECQSDDPTAFTILVEDGRFKVHQCLLDEALREGFQAIASVLFQADHIRAELCATFSVNTGDYTFHNGQYCSHGQLGTSLSQFKAHKFCPQQCIHDDGVPCPKCHDEYVCEQCLEMGNYRYCLECGRVSYAVEGRNHCEDCWGILRHYYGDSADSDDDDYWDKVSELAFDYYEGYD